MHLIVVEVKVPLRAKGQTDIAWCRITGQLLMRSQGTTRMVGASCGAAEVNTPLQAFKTTLDPALHFGVGCVFPVSL